MGIKRYCCIKQIRRMRGWRILHFDPKSRGSGIEEGEVLHLFAPKLRKWELWLVHGIRKKSKSLQNGTCDSFAHMPAIHGRRSARRLCRDFGDIAWQYTLHNKNPWNCCNSKGFILVGMTGFEPAAFASRTQRSTKLSHIPASAIKFVFRLPTCIL